MKEACRQADSGEMPADDTNVRTIGYSYTECALLYEFKLIRQICNKTMCQIATAYSETAGE